eukprot:TRINITY_DN9854_c0_g1_i1.p1 TRINITY_DN9854_c0_g1~~TRINITY_DN9854_c0_g1_i1.p1  ORF type:complete len:525 (-),score=112.03 TRINITY_DN9854_c0_g1_i1:8-1390(-)
MAGDWAYNYLCKQCNPDGTEVFSKLPTKSWIDIVQIAIWNLMMNMNGERLHFSVDVISEMIDTNWENLCCGKKRSATNILATVTRTVSHEDHINRIFIEDQFGWGLVEKFNPYVLHGIGYRSGTLTRAHENPFKRKREISDESRVKKKRKLSKLPEPEMMIFDYYTPEKYNFKKIALVPANSSTEIIITNNGLTARNQKGYRMGMASHHVIEGGWYWEAVLEDPLKFQRKRKDPNPSWRLGWSSSRSSVQAPVGYDELSYGYISACGKKVNNATPAEYGEPYKAGDVIGFFIEVPEVESDEESVNDKMKVDTILNSNNNNNNEPEFVNKDKKPGNSLPSEVMVESMFENLDSGNAIDTKNKVDTEIGAEDHNSQSANTKPDKEDMRLIGSKIVFYKNGINQGVAYEDILDGDYYPAVSLYYQAQVTCNFGPDFKYPPDDIEYRPMSDFNTKDSKIHQISK